ncbi:MAG: hypothetical protein BJ554DRAFT_1291 [Olpidium bornovanus]|uniref:Uncharacterized protein n=1 Tax=Olpidium bornovanus TaxID=278681 RepID=A0A8H7ZS97_9FUNG|nr:MAG: hypothetical protein BJ554DRAFT_1291 [Olpidium bornovanus]
MVAQVFLPKTVHRLGNSVTGVVDFANGVIPEDVELATKRVHAQRHEFCLNTRRTSFDLFIPPAATPEFRTTAVSLKWFVRFEFLTGLGDRPWLPSTFHGVRASLHRIEDAAPVVDIEAFDCLVPIKVLPTDFVEGKKYADSKILEL